MAAEATNAPVRRECMTAPRFAAPAGSLADTASPTRRALIGGAGLAAIVAVAPAIGAGGSADATPIAISPALAALIEDADAKEAAYMAYTRAYLTPAEQRYDAIRLKGNVKAMARAGSARDAINARQEALVDRCTEAQYEVCSYPAATPADLHAKLAFMVKHQMFDGMNWGPEILADARRAAKIEG